MERGGSLYYYHRDGLGSVSEISNESGNLVERYEYDVYGNPQIFDSSDTQLNASAIGNPYLFTGRRYDPESGNYYYRARIYSPELGRFLQTDPLGYVDGLNLYAYVGNNPASWIDPYGEDPISLATLALLGLAGGAIGIATTEPGQDAFEALTEHLIHAVETFPENAANVYRQVKDLFAPPEEIPPLPGTPANTEPIDTTEQLIPPDMSTFWGPLITPDDGVCYPEPEIFPGHGDDPLLGPIIADPFPEAVGPTTYATGRPQIETDLSGRVIRGLPVGDIRTPAEVRQARNFFKRNREAARGWWEQRTGQMWPSDSTHDEHPRAIKDGGDPLYIEPGYGGPSAEHSAPRSDGITDFQRWGGMGGRPKN